MAAPQFLFFYGIALLLAAENPEAAVWTLVLYATTIIRSIWQSRRF